MSEDNPTHTNLYVRHLPLEWTKEHMCGIFAPYGHILSSKLLMDANNPNQSRGMGFVRFVNHQDAVNACKMMDGYVPEGSHKALSVKFAKDQQQGRSSAEEAIAATADTSVAAQAPSASGLAGDDKNLYVRDLPLTFTKEEFHKMYAPFGELVSSTVLADSTTGVSRGIGFARYANHDAAVAALKATDGMILPGAIKPIIVQFARDTSRKNAPPPSHQQQQHPPPTIPTMIIDPITGIPYLVPMPFFHPAHLAAPVQQPPPQQSNAAAAAAAASPFANIPAPLPVTASGITTMPAPPPGMGAPILPPAPATAPVADPYAAYYAYAGYGAAAAAAPAPPAAPAQASTPGYPPAPYNPYGQAAPPQAYAPYAVPQQGYGYPPPPPPPPSAPMGRGSGASVRYSPYGPPSHRGRSNGVNGAE